MKYIRLALVFGWFFAMRASYDDQGAFLTTVVGPFKSEQACKAEFEEMKDTAESVKLAVKFIPCQFKQEL